MSITGASGSLNLNASTLNPHVQALHCNSEEVTTSISGSAVLLSRYPVESSLTVHDMLSRISASTAANAATMTTASMTQLLYCCYYCSCYNNSYYLLTT